MTRKLMAFDLDGTLLFHDGIAPQAVDAIRAWQEAGNLAVTATGKSIAATQLALKDSGLTFDHHVLFTGAVIAGPDYRVEASSTIPTEVVSSVAEQLVDAPDLNVYATTLDTSDVQLVSNVQNLNTGILVDFAPLGFDQIPEHTFVGVPIWVPADEERITALHSWISEEFPAVDCHRNQDFLDIVPKGATKGAGLQRLVQLLGEPLEVHTIGDSWNDLGMHTIADRSASFPYSPPEVRASTDIVVERAADFIYASL